MLNKYLINKSKQMKQINKNKIENKYNTYKWIH